MNKFLHEINDDMLNEAKRQIAKNNENYNEYYLLQEIHEEWSFISSEFSYTDQSVPFTASMYRGEAEDSLFIETFLQIIEEEYLQDYSVEITDNHTSRISYKYTHKETNRSIILSFINKLCKTIETGRMIPETIVVCSRS